MALSQRERNSLLAFLRHSSRLELTPSDALRKYLIDNYQDFLPHNLTSKKYRFTETQKQALVSVLRQHERDLFIKPLPTQNRIEVSAYKGDEKSALVAPESEHALVSNHKGIIPLTDDNLALPPKLSVRVPVVNINVENIDCLIVVENLDVFDVWSQVNWPQRPARALAVYRGHEKNNSVGMKALVNRLPPSVRVVMFPDCDPAGIKIGLTLPRIDAFLAPSSIDLGNRDHKLLDDYYKQQREVQFIEKHSRYTGSHFLSKFTDVQKPLIWRQQHMIAQNTELNLYFI